MEDRFFVKPPHEWADEQKSGELNEANRKYLEKSLKSFVKASTAKNCLEVELFSSSDVSCSAGFTVSALCSLEERGLFLSQAELDRLGIDQVGTVSTARTDSVQYGPVVIKAGGVNYTIPEVYRLTAEQQSSLPCTATAILGYNLLRSHAVVWVGGDIYLLSEQQWIVKFRFWKPVDHATQGPSVEIVQQTPPRGSPGRLQSCSCCSCVETEFMQFKPCYLCKAQGWEEPKFYCGKACQELDWRSKHKLEHQARRALPDTRNPAAGPLPVNATIETEKLSFAELRALALQSSFGVKRNSSSNSLADSDSHSEALVQQEESLEEPELLEDVIEVPGSNAVIDCKKLPFATLRALALQSSLTNTPDQSGKAVQATTAVTETKPCRTFTKSQSAPGNRPVETPKTTEPLPANATVDSSNLSFEALRTLAFQSSTSQRTRVSSPGSPDVKSDQQSGRKPEQDVSKEPKQFPPVAASQVDTKKAEAVLHNGASFDFKYEDCSTKSHDTLCTVLPMTCPQMKASTPQVCDCCQAEETEQLRLKYCAACLREGLLPPKRYCCKECQVLDWKIRHKSDHHAAKQQAQFSSAAFLRAIQRLAAMQLEVNEHYVEPL